MQEISTTTKNLPQTLEEKTKYVLFGAEALNIYRAKLRAMEKAGISKEQYEQLKMEAQETAENLLLFSADIGKEMQKIDKAQGFASAIRDVDDKNVKTKTNTIHEMGFTDRQARDFQTLAKHPEVINKAIEDARAEDRIVTRSDVLNRIAPPKSTKQMMKEFKQEARERHEEFKQASQDGVVDFEDIQQDKDDSKYIALDTLTTINRALAGITALGLLKNSEIELMTKNLKAIAKQDLVSNCYEASRVITHLLKVIGGR